MDDLVMTRWKSVWYPLASQIVADPAAPRTFSSPNRTPNFVFWAVLALAAIGLLHKLAKWLGARNAVVNLEGGEAGCRGHRRVG